MGLQILKTLEIGFQFGIELLKYFQTEQGQKDLIELRENRANFAKWLEETGSDIKKLLTTQ